ncbi:hypothetical protein PENCOP_c001G06673 [Penicillium coprophilum]|uniref:Uncharacterized protein n=1 Tax=Penicillium coprophilum TaxID=36646 RepID=A0A1V6V8Y1_9EURO|nr:hypothetical protein PENCOP_c001G06673 [Penicillium coprophilum]
MTELLLPMITAQKISGKKSTNENTLQALLGETWTRDWSTLDAVQVALVDVRGTLRSLLNIDQVGSFVGESRSGSPISLDDMVNLRWMAAKCTCAGHGLCPVSLSDVRKLCHQRSDQVGSLLGEPLWEDLKSDRVCTIPVLAGPAKFQCIQQNF